MCSLTFVNVTNPNIIEVAAKSPCVIHPPNQGDRVADWKPKIGVQSWKLTELASPTSKPPIFVKFLHMSPSFSNLIEKAMKFHTCHHHI